MPELTDRDKVTLMVGVIEDGFDESLEDTFKAVLTEKSEQYLNECRRSDIPFSVMDFATYIFYAAGKEDATREILLHEKAKGRLGDIG